jgi:hypothetical protein
VLPGPSESMRTTGAMIIRCRMPFPLADVSILRTGIKGSRAGRPGGVGALVVA